MFLSKRQNGIYYIFYSDCITGKRKKITTKSKKKSDALKFLMDFTQRNSVKIESKPIVYIERLSDLKNEILKNISLNLSKSTLQIYLRVFKELIRALNNKRVEDITQSDLERFKSIRLEKIKKTTINIEVRTIKAIFNLGNRMNIINVNPSKNFNQMITPEKEMLSMNQEEIQKLINVIDEEKFKNIVLFGLYTGCRLNEILNIQWKDLDFKEKAIIIRNKANFKTKTGKIRNIPISEELFNILLKMKRSDGDSTIIRLYSEDDYIFGNKCNKVYSKSYISRKFKTYTRKANLPDKFHFHCLRHTALTQLAMNGVSMYKMKEIAGHSCLKTTEHYIHTNIEDLREAINKINLPV